MPLKPVRKIRPSSRSITGKSPSYKTRTIQHFESALERDFLTLLEFDDTVEDYGVQPVTIHYYHSGKPARYTPDIEIQYKPDLDKMPVLCEIKYEAELLKKWAYYEPKFSAAKDYAFVNGYEFKVFTEREIRTDYLHNVKFLSRYRNRQINEACVKIIMEELTINPSVTPNKLIVQATKEENAKLLFALWQMLAERIITCDMQQKLSMNTILWKNQDQ